MHSFSDEVQFCKENKIFDPIFSCLPPRGPPNNSHVFEYIMKMYWQEDILDLGSISDTFIGEDESSGNHTNTY